VLRVKSGKRPALRNLIVRNDAHRDLLDQEGIVFDSKGIFQDQGEQLWTFTDIEEQLEAVVADASDGEEDRSDQEQAGVDNEEDGIVDGEDSTGLKRKRASS
jgi:hypothetical protein